MTPGAMKKSISTAYLLFYSRRTKSIRAHVCLATNLTSLPRKLKIAPTTLCTITENASLALPASLLRTSTGLSNHISKASSYFCGDDPEASGTPSPPNTLVIASAIVEVAIEKVVSIVTIVITSSRNKLQILSAKDLPLSRTF